MQAAYVLRQDDDDHFVKEWVLPPLAALGFERALITSTSGSTPEEIERSAVALVVVTKDAAESAEFGQAVEVALRSQTPVVALFRGTSEFPSTIMGELNTAVGIDVHSLAEPADLWRRLVRLLPSPDGVAAADPEGGEPLIWDAQAFSVLLAESIARNDFALGAALVSRFEQHVESPYPVGNGRADLQCLREGRLFVLMRRYAEAVIAAGMPDFEVRRQYAQALIELKAFDEAIRVLEQIIAETPARHVENFEARGLLARAFKQRYVDAGSRAEPQWLTTAIATYWAAFIENDKNLWHGINAASCLLRAERDGVAPPPADPPHRIAQRVLEILDEREQAADGQQLDIWGSATRVEAYVDLGDFPKALRSVAEYITHPAMKPFEASSTYRQLDELLQLGESAEGRAILDRLLECAKRMRGGGLIGTADPDEKRFLVRVADPGWTPTGVPDLEIGSRLGTIVTIKGSTDTLDALLKDPLVVSIEESRPAPLPDTERSLPFVQVQENYQWDEGPFVERGAEALIAIVDDGVDVLHEAFLDDQGASRILGIWDQTDRDAAPSADVAFGRLHTAAEITDYVRKNRVPHGLAARGRHGTHVASIAAGRRCGEFGGGVAPEARLLVVIPRASGPTGYSTAHLDALAFIDRMATSLDLPVVVNVSQGMNAGAHDGKSSLEIGFNAFCGGGREPGRIVVKSAGNERLKRGHAKLTVPQGGADELVWRCPVGRARPINVELWWNAADDYRFQLQSPEGEYSAWVDRRHPVAEGLSTGSGKYRIELVPAHVDNGDKLLRIQFTTGSRMRSDEEWTLTIEAAAVRRAGDIHAWIERDNAPPTEFVGHDTEEMTISVPGTADAVITVGAVKSALPVRVGRFSSFGPTRDGREKPDLCAPGVEIPAALHGSGDGVISMCGTSQAAPHVTGAVALLLSKAKTSGAAVPTASQIRAILTNTTRFKNGFWDRGQGFGVLDVKALMEEGLPTLI